jgi:cysteine sulfinate desulfinase/cysteine desulfurase-like protein
MSKTVANAAYLDHNATSPIRPEAFEAVCEAMKMGGNPTSIHRSGRAARALLEEARAQVACLVEAEPSEVVFTSGGTEAIFRLMRKASWIGRNWQRGCTATRHRLLSR